MHSVVHTIVFMPDDRFRAMLEDFLQEDPVLCMIALRMMNARACFSSECDWYEYVRIVYDMDD